jgi:hypothetical protein
MRETGLVFTMLDLGCSGPTRLSSPGRAEDPAAEMCIFLLCYHRSHHQLVGASKQGSVRWAVG